MLPKNVTLNGAQFVRVTDQNHQPLDQMFNLTRFETAVQQLYHDYWCRQKKLRGWKIWCQEQPPAAIVFQEPADALVEDLHLEPDDWSPQGLTEVGEMAHEQIYHEDMRRSSSNWMRSTAALARGGKVSVLRIEVPCEFWFRVRVVEGSAFWNEFWKINDALEFNDDILNVGRSTQQALLKHFGPTATEKARSLGYRLRPEDVAGAARGYHVVHLRAEQDWHVHCKRWTNWQMRRDNCSWALEAVSLNNTFDMGNVLLAEGVPPGFPVYLATGLSETEMDELRSRPSMQSFFNIYTVVTKAMLGLPADVGSRREYWAAVDYMFSQQAHWFIGNSISTFSALTIQCRARQKLPVLSYNGGTMALEDMDGIRPNPLTRIPPTRPEIKWLFTLPRRMHENSLIFNETMVALKSAAEKTQLIPVCVTAEDPTNSLIVMLVSMGVRVIYHTPSWAEPLEERLLMQKNASLSQLDALMAQWLRIDLPNIGILDEFVLYTSLNVMFTDDIFWKDLLGKNHLTLRDSLAHKMWGKVFFNDWAPPGHLGIPRFLGMASRWGQRVPAELDGDDDPDCGVVLMNLRGLRDSNEKFRSYREEQYVMKKKLKQLLKWAQFQGSDPCIYEGFYYRSTLPGRLVWSPQRMFAGLVHFEGINCQLDVAPYKKFGGGRSQHHRLRVEECFDLEFCRNSYLEFCSAYDTYLLPSPPKQRGA
eukprot:Skav213490  [mRNA]  locus=scaffold3849:105905:112205:- [translate_table: standard]